MKSKLIITILALMCALGSVAMDFGPERYNYYINWKWGLISMRAAHASVTVGCNGGVLNGTMSGSSIPWHDRVYCVDDNLRCVCNDDMETVEYINGWYRKPKLDSHQNPDASTDYRNILGEGSLSCSPATMEAVEVTANMISMFYYARTLDFSKEGTTVTIPITNADGTASSLQIQMQGQGPSQAGACDGDVYYVTFTYTVPDHAESYPVKCEISVDRRVPVYFSTNIKIGHVEMILD